jgi:diacylglycerol O-acyltransferase 1
MKCQPCPSLQLTERSSLGAHYSGYAYKYRPHAVAALFADPWVLRFFVIQDGALTYFQSERDVQYPPRGHITLAGTYVDYEGVKRRKYHVFKVVDRDGDDLIRLSTESRSTASAWMDALERAGCLRRVDDASQSPGPSQISPSNSVRSDTTDTATSGHGRGSSQRDALGRPTSHVATRLNLDRNLTGYTSDASDVGHRQRRVAASGPPANRQGGRPTHAPSESVHRSCRESILTADDVQYSRQMGLITLVMIILAVTNFRLILENLIKYGLRFNPFTFVRAVLTPAGNVLLLLCWPALACSITAALLIERVAMSCFAMELRAEDGDRKKEMSRERRCRRAATRASVAEYFVFALNLINTTVALGLPCGVIHVTNADPLPSFAVTMATAVVWLKLVSYAHVNAALRREVRGMPISDRYAALQSQSDDHLEPLKWPHNLTLGNIWYFAVVPTLCYQLEYPRSSRFRLRWTLRRISMLCISLGTMLFIMEQYIQPTIDNSLKLLQEMDWLRMVERVLKLSIPTLYFWLAMFYALFHLWLNVLAELTRFGDREFYKDWWNATTLGEYWRTWNMPVHKWMLRHIYFPCIRAGLPKFAAGVICFFVSAIFHELLVGVPLHMLRGWAFWGIMAQVPLIWMTELLKKRFNNDYVGNVIFWVSFCFLGQPLAEILYYHDWRKLSA